MTYRCFIWVLLLTVFVSLANPSTVCAQNADKPSFASDPSTPNSGGDASSADAQHGSRTPQVQPRKEIESRKPIQARAPIQPRQ